MEQEGYQIFDKSQADQYHLVVTSNENINKVCKILTQCYTLSSEDRVYYARHGDIKPEVNEEGDKATYNFKGLYNEVTVWPALAEVLFYDGPRLVSIKDDGEAFIPEEKETDFNKLIRSRVLAARDDFLAKFGVNPPEVKTLFSALKNARIPMTTNALMELAEKEMVNANNTDET